MVVTETPEVSVNVDNQRIAEMTALLQPNYVQELVPLTPQIEKHVDSARQRISKILKGDSDRIIVIAGPCSIHDVESALEFAKRLTELQVKYAETLEVVMRVYFEKPRTIKGWKGLINDPDLDGRCDVNKGLVIGRFVLREINAMGLPCATEWLESYTPQYLGDLISYGAIGARTTRCSLHVRLSSGCSMPIGFKNATDGDIAAAVGSCVLASKPQSFLGITGDGVPAQFMTVGNDDCHVILRGGTSGTNFDRETLERSWDEGVMAAISSTGAVVDCSHGNSNKDHRNQPRVVESICQTLIDGGRKLVSGVMLEAHLVEGAQKLPDALPRAKSGELNGAETLGGGHAALIEQLVSSVFQQKKNVLSGLKYGQSVTDACIDVSTLTTCLSKLDATLKSIR